MDDIITAHCTWEGDPEDLDFDKNAWAGGRTTPPDLQVLTAHCKGQEVRPAKHGPGRAGIAYCTEVIPAAAGGAMLQQWSCRIIGGARYTGSTCSSQRLDGAACPS